MMLTYYDADGCCVGSEIVPAGEWRIPSAPRAAFFTASQLIDDRIDAELVMHLS
jgi:hypothetical protein